MSQGRDVQQPPAKIQSRCQPDPKGEARRHARTQMGKNVQKTRIGGSNLKALSLLNRRSVGRSGPTSSALSKQRVHKVDAVRERLVGAFRKSRSLGRFLDVVIELSQSIALVLAKSLAILLLGADSPLQLRSPVALKVKGALSWSAKSCPAGLQD